MAIFVVSCIAFAVILLFLNLLFGKLFRYIRQKIFVLMGAAKPPEVGG